LKIGTCELFQIALCRGSGREWPARHPAVWDERDVGPCLYHPTVLTKLAHQAAAGAPAPPVVVGWLVLADTALEQRVIFIFFHCLSLVASIAAARTQVRFSAIADCCAHTASGHVAAAPPSVAKNFRGPM